MAKLDLQAKTGELFQRALKEGIPRKGDDSLFALFQLVYPELSYKKLEREYNFITNTAASPGAEWLTRHESLIHEVVFIHFTGYPKPWSTEENYPDYTYKYFVHKWRQRLIDNFTPKDLRKHFHGIYNQLKRDHLRFYWYPSDNVGDLVTPYFLQKVCKVKALSDYMISEEEIVTIEAEAREEPRRKRVFFRSTAQKNGARYCVSTGSVIRLCGDKALVFGSGIRSKDQEVHPSYVRSVRGPLTRGRFIAKGFECPPIYGDPGLLLPHFYTPKKAEKLYELGIIPHFTEYEKVKELYKNDKNVLVINLGTGDLEGALDQIAACKATVSSSLHGLVFSHAYKVSTRRIIFSDQIFGDGTKFRDYYQGIKLQPLEPIRANGFKKIPSRNLISEKKEMLEHFDDTRLLDAMFFDQHDFRRSAQYPN